MQEAIRVLLVEDNPGDVELTRELLEATGLQVRLRVASDGQQALALLLRAPAPGAAAATDLVLLDLNLPRLSGRELLAEMRRHEALRALPVVVLTSSDAEQDLQAGQELGACRVMTKPLGVQAMRDAVHLLRTVLPAALGRPP